MKLGIPVPNYFVVPNDMFDKSSGRSMAEFEFPVISFQILSTGKLRVCRPISIFSSKRNV